MASRMHVMDAEIQIYEKFVLPSDIPKYYITIISMSKLIFFAFI